MVMLGDPSAAMMQRGRRLEIIAESDRRPEDGQNGEQQGQQPQGDDRRDPPAAWRWRRRGRSRAVSPARRRATAARAGSPTRDADQGQAGSAENSTGREAMKPIVPDGYARGLVSSLVNGLFPAHRRMSVFTRRFRNQTYSHRGSVFRVLSPPLSQARADLAQAPRPRLGELARPNRASRK